MSRPTVVWWIRRDLRLGDNPALNAAAAAGEVIPLFIVDDVLWKPAGDVRRSWLVGCLESLDRSVGGHLVVRRGVPADVLVAVAVVTASFLVKDLHVDWTRGARHFLAHLVDGDLASNNHGWQWVAGTGPRVAIFARALHPLPLGGGPPARSRQLSRTYRRPLR